MKKGSTKKIKDTIHSIISELSHEVTLKKMVDKYKLLPEEFMMPGPRNPVSSIVFKKEYQDEYNRRYNAHYEGIKDILMVDFNTEDGIRKLTLEDIQLIYAESDVCMYVCMYVCGKPWQVFQLLE